MAQLPAVVVIYAAALSGAVIVKLLAPAGLNVREEVPPLRVALLPRNVTLGELTVKALPPAI